MTDIPKMVSKRMLVKWIVVKNRYESDDGKLPLPLPDPSTRKFTFTAASGL